MRKHISLALAALAFGLLFSAGTEAQATPCGTVPYTFTNGTIADANQVNSNFASIFGCGNNTLSPSSITATGGSTAATLANRFGHILNAVDDFGADPTGATNTTAALQLALDAACSASPKLLYIPPGFYHHTGLTIGAFNCTINGAGTGVTRLINTSTTSTDLTVTHAGANIFTIRDLDLLESSNGNKVSGYALKITESYFPVVERVSITGWNGVWNDSSNSLTMRSVNMQDLNGTEGILIRGTAIVPVFAMTIDDLVAGAQANTGIVWIDQDSYAYSVEIVHAKLIYGGTCLQMRDSLAVAANASVPYWMFASHVECDHQNGDAVSLAKGGGFQMGPSSWIGSSIAGAGIGIGTGWLSNSYISGRINGNFKEGIAILGGTNARVIGAAITANGNGAGHTYETRIGANVNDVRMVGNTISNLGDGDSSTDLGCILVEAGTGNHLNIRANGLACSATAISNSASGTANFVETAEAPSVSTLPTAAGAGGLYVCVDTAGLLYKKSACP